jgi:adenylylsulfate kinase
MTGVVVWITGLPSSGKSTLARALHERVPGSALLDGDDLRAILGDAAHDDAARDAFYTKLAALAAYLAEQGLIAIVAATAHKRVYRERAKAMAPSFLEVFVATPQEECERRDAKGLYAKARRGEAPALPGVGVAYEVPTCANVLARGGLDASAIDRIAAELSARRAR